MEYRTLDEKYWWELPIRDDEQAILAAESPGLRGVPSEKNTFLNFPVIIRCFIIFF